MADKPTMHSPDLTRENIEKIASLFPSCITESRDEKGNVVNAVDFDLLRQELSPQLVEGPTERYRLDWPGENRCGRCFGMQPLTGTTAVSTFRNTLPSFLPTRRSR